MNAVTALAGATVSGIWKSATIVLTAVLLAATGATGTGWWLAARDRDLALAALAGEKGVSAALRSSISEQNRAVEGMA